MLVRKQRNTLNYFFIIIEIQIVESCLGNKSSCPSGGNGKVSIADAISALGKSMQPKLLIADNTFSALMLA